jgi:hypothetical protein
MPHVLCGFGQLGLQRLGAQCELCCCSNRTKLIHLVPTRIEWYSQCGWKFYNLRSGVCRSPKRPKSGYDLLRPTWANRRNWPRPLASRIRATCLRSYAKTRNVPISVVRKARHKAKHLADSLRRRLGSSNWHHTRVVAHSMRRDHAKNSKKFWKLAQLVARSFYSLSAWTHSSNSMKTCGRVRSTPRPTSYCCNGKL